MINIFDKHLSKYFSEDELNVAALYAKKIDGKCMGNFLIEKILAKHSDKECIEILENVINTYYEFGDFKTKELIDKTIQSYQ